MNVVRNERNELSSSALLGWFGRQDVDAIFTALASEQMSDAGNAMCPFPMDDAVSIWLSNTPPDEWIPKLCDELKRNGFSIQPNR